SGSVTTDPWIASVTAGSGREWAATLSARRSAVIMSFHDGDALDFGARVVGEARRAEGAARWELARCEHRPVHVVHRRPLLDVREEYGAFHDVLHVGAVGFQDDLDVGEGLLGFGADAAGDELPVIGAELTGEEEHVAHSHRRGEGGGALGIGGEELGGLGECHGWGENNCCNGDQSTHFYLLMGRA